MGKESRASALRETAELLDILEQFGVTAAYSSLKNSPVEPAQCMSRAKHSIRVYMYRGRKWLGEGWFEKGLGRLRRAGGTVKLLLSNEILQQEEELDRANRLLREYPKTLTIRLFDHVPMWRIVLIDKRIAVVGHYGHEVIDEDGENKKGWASPMIELEEGSEWSLLVPFRALMYREWDRAQPHELPPQV